MGKIIVERVTVGTSSTTVDLAGKLKTAYFEVETSGANVYANWEQSGRAATTQDFPVDGLEIRREDTEHTDIQQIQLISDTANTVVKIIYTIWD